jgi:hypothetical protein
VLPELMQTGPKKKKKKKKKPVIVFNLTLGINHLSMNCELGKYPYERGPL